MHFNKKKHEKIFDEIMKKIDGSKIVLDGVVSPHHYENASKKLIWILKEVNDKGGGGWDLREFIRCHFKNDEGIVYPRWKSSYALITKVSAGILLGLTDFEKAKEFATTPEKAIEILCQIAVININKCPGGSRTNWSSLKIAFDKFKSFLVRQIDLIDPQIIICGNTFDFFYKGHPNIDDSNPNVYRLAGC